MLPPPQLILDGNSRWETVYNATADTCPLPLSPFSGKPYDGTDSMPAAYFSPHTNLTYMWAAVSGGVRPNVGADGLSSVRHDCNRVLFNSSFDASPASYANFQWLQSAHVDADGSGWALVHNEFHGFDEAVNASGAYCSYDRHNNTEHLCNMWSTGLATTADGGETWQLAAPPPAHRVFSSPYRYVKDARTFGYGALSTALRGDDGAFYALVHVFGSGRQPGGNCAVRSATPSVPDSWVGYNGSAWATHWVDPYRTNTSADSALCAPVTGDSDGVSHPSPRRLVGFASSWPSFVLFGDGAGVDGHAGVTYRFSWEGDFARAITRWGAPQTAQVLRLGLERWVHPIGGKVLYPTLLDAASPRLGSNNFANVGNGSSSSYVYVNVQRSLLRHRVRFVAAGTAPSPPPAPPPVPPTPANCTCFRVRGAASGSGDYVLQPLRNPAPFFQLDDTHQLYRFSGRWKIAQYANPAAVLYMPYSAGNESLPPSGAMWGSINLDFAPAPLSVACCSPNDRTSSNDDIQAKK